MQNTNLHNARELISKGRLIEAREMLNTFLEKHFEDLPETLKEVVYKELENTYPYKTVNIFLNHLRHRDLMFISNIHSNAGDSFVAPQEINSQVKLPESNKFVESVRRIESHLLEIKLINYQLDNFVCYQPFLEIHHEQTKVFYNELVIQNLHESRFVIRLTDEYLPVILAQKSSTDNEIKEISEIIYFPSLCQGGLHFSELFNAFPSLEGHAIQSLSEKYINNLLKSKDRVKKILVCGDMFTGHYPINSFSFKSWLKLVFNVDTENSHVSTKACSGDIVIRIPESYIPTIATLTSVQGKNSVDSVTKDAIGVICKHDFNPSSFCQIVRDDKLNNHLFPAVLQDTNLRIQKNDSRINLDMLSNNLNFIYMKNEIQPFDISYMYEFSNKEPFKSAADTFSSVPSIINTKKLQNLAKLSVVVNNLLEAVNPVKCIFSLLLQENILIDQLYLIKNNSREEDFRKLLEILEIEFKHIRKYKKIPLKIIDQGLDDLLENIQDQQICFVDASIFLPTNSILFQAINLASSYESISSIGLSIATLKHGDSSLLNLQSNGLKCEQISASCKELKLKSNQVNSFFGFYSMPFNVISNTPDFVIIPVETIKTYLKSKNYHLSLEQQLIDIMIQAIFEGKTNLCIPHLGVINSTRASNMNYVVNLQPHDFSKELIFNILEKVTFSERILQ